MVCPRLFALAILLFVSVFASRLRLTGVDPPIHRSAPKAIDYNHDVRPILSDRCFICHGPDENKRKGGLRLDTRAGALENGAVVPGKPAESLLIERITADDGKRMPPRKSNLTLTPNEIDTLRRWVAEGAEYKPHWAFIPIPEVVPIPTVLEGAWPVNPIDRFILSRLDHEVLTPSPAASRDDWIRRVTYDLTGLPPTPDEVDEFLADQIPGAFDKVVDRLLASPRFGERLTMEWLDAARYADSFGYQADGDMHVWPWRDWVIRAFNENLPFDQFITWQLAGDLLDKPSRDQRLATAFCRLNRMTNEGGSIAEEFRNEYVSDRVHTFGTVFLGLTLECARCHDHKYDPIAMKDYYALGAFFNSIDEWGTYDNSHFRPTPTLPLPTPAQERDLAFKKKKVDELSNYVRKLEKKTAATSSHGAARLDAKGRLPGLVGDYPLDAIDGKHQLQNRADPKHPGTTAAANTLVPGKIGQALQFTGDDPAQFPHVLGGLERWQPFTVAFWLHIPADIKSAIIFHRQSGTDTGFHGTELTLDDGRLAFGMIRFWPGNAIAVRTKRTLNAQPQWTHVGVTYDGSSKAVGLRIYLDGIEAETEVVRDNLTKNLETGAGHGGGGTGLTFGERFRSTGLKGGAIDELRVYNRALEPGEMSQLHDDIEEYISPKSKQTEHVTAFDKELSQRRNELQQARQNLFVAETGVFEIMTMEETSRPRQAFILNRGEYDAPKDRPVGRDTPAALPPFPPATPRNRLGLAQWLTDPRHPLTARVAVNRTWQMFFGRGLVASADNLGQQGALPSHPELLDWLARDFIASDWDVKFLCKQIALSATYRQRSAASPHLRERDPDNVLLARAPSRRLSAEMVRDMALATSGLLVERFGGQPVKPYQPPGLWHEQNAFLPEYVADKGAGLYRRSLYTFWRRTSPPPNMLTFDAPSREVCVVRRQATNTPLQPLVLLNDPQFVEAARALGERMIRIDGKLDDKLTFGFRLVASRAPTPQERDLLAHSYRRQLALFGEKPDLAEKYLKIGNRPLPSNVQPTELAALAATASLLLNLDATVSLR